MKPRSVVCCAPALLAVLLLPACGNSTESGAPSAVAGSSTGGKPSGTGGNAGGAVGASGGTNGGSASSAGMSPSAGPGGAPSGMGGATSAGAGGTLGASGRSSGGAGGSAGTPGAMIPDTKVVMYLPNWNGSFASWATKIDFSKMTHLNLAFGTVKAGTNEWDLGAADGDVKTLAAAAHAAHVKVLVSIGGADDDLPIINRYQTESNIDPLVASLDAFVARLDLDGVDVDLERGSYLKSTGNFSKFVNKLNATFKPEGKLVTSALAQYIIEEAGDDATITAWLKSFDFINLMIYSTNMNTYTSELDWWTNQRGIPKKQLTWGVEFSSKSSTDWVKQLTTASKAYGGVMVWEFSLDKTGKLWPAVQSSL